MRPRHREATDPPRSSRKRNPNTIEPAPTRTDLGGSTSPDNQSRTSSPSVLHRSLSSRTTSNPAQSPSTAHVDSSSSRHTSQSSALPQAVGCSTAFSNAHHSMSTREFKRLSGWERGRPDKTVISKDIGWRGMCLFYVWVCVLQ